MSEDLVDRDSAPPPYEERALPARRSLASQLNGSYTPIQYNVANQVPQEFYEVLIDESNHPSEVFCRMADALFFHLDTHCNQFRGTQHIEPAKLAWLEVALGQDIELSMVIQKNLPALYDAVSIPYTFDITQTPVLDRRGLLHLCVFQVCADPAYALRKWNKTLNVLKLRDPLTKLTFPTPIPCSAFPSVSDFLLNELYANWQIMALTASTPRQSSKAMPIQHKRESSGNNSLHTPMTAQAAPIARQSAFQTMQHFGRLQRIQAELSRSMQLETSQSLQVRTLELARMVEEVDRDRNNGLHASPTAQVQQTVSLARLAAFQTVRQFERLQNPAAKSTSTHLEIPLNTRKASDTQIGSSRVSGVPRREEANMERNNGLYKSPTAQVQEAISIARRAAFQAAQGTERLQKI